MRLSCLFRGALFGLTPGLKDGEYFAGDGGVLFMPLRFKHWYYEPLQGHASKFCTCLLCDLVFVQVEIRLSTAAIDRVGNNDKYEVCSKD